MHVYNLSIHVLHFQQKWILRRLKIYSYLLIHELKRGFNVFTNQYYQRRIWLLSDIIIQYSCSEDTQEP